MGRESLVGTILSTFMVAIFLVLIGLGVMTARAQNDDPHAMNSNFQRDPTAAAPAAVETVAGQTKRDLIIQSHYERTQASRILEDARKIRAAAGPDLPLVCEEDGGQLPRVHEDRQPL